MILGICGSPRKQATDHVLNEALKMLEERGFETEFFGVRGKDISPCLHCDYCMRKGVCIQKDDMYEVYPLMTEAEGIIMATPIYNGGLSAQLKAIMDRTRALGAVDYNFLRNKVGMAIFCWWRQKRRTGISYTANIHLLYTHRDDSRWWRCLRS